MLIGERIQKLRKSEKITQEQFGVEIGVSDKAVSKWETNGGIPDIVIMQTIAKYFHISIDYLINGNIIT